MRIMELPQSLRRHLYIITRTENRQDRLISTLVNFLRDKALIRTTSIWRSGMMILDY